MPGENMSGEGSMNRYKATIIPLNNCKLNKNSFLKHLSNKYANNPAGLFGTIPINNILSKNNEIEYDYKKIPLLK
jgi:hypothetical protein